MGAVTRRVMQSGVTVILVGDDDSFTHGLAELLESQSYRVRIAVSARMAVAEIERASEPVVVSDLGASKMQAVELALALRELRRSVPTVAISSMPNIAQHCAALGIKHYLSQPFRLGELTDLIDRLAEPEQVTFASAPGGVFAALAS